MKSAFYVIIRFLFYWPAKLIFRVRVRGRKNEPSPLYQVIRRCILMCLVCQRMSHSVMFKRDYLHTLVGDFLLWKEW